MSVFLLATLDTKGPEAQFVRDDLQRAGLDVVMVDTGCLGSPTVSCDISREQFFQYANVALSDLVARQDRGEAITRAAEAAAALLGQAYAQGQVQGVIALGGSAGTTIGAAGMRALPIGVPKLMVSTLASGDVSPWVGDKDIMMMNSVVDIAGINRISRRILRQAAGALVGAVKAPATADDDDRPLIAATMFGVTTPCVQRARTILEGAGYEVLVFHATGSGGRAMESLIRDGLIEGVLDITTTELADELVGGILSAGPDRLTAAGKQGIPQVISVGATDMVNFGEPGSVPQEFADRRLYHHNPTVTLMRTNAGECAALGHEIARKASASQAPTALMLPLRGVSAIDKEGQPFDDPQARIAMFDAIRADVGAAELLELDLHINDDAFAEAAANQLLSMLTEVRAEKSD